MTDRLTTDAQLAMADRIADKMYPRTHPGWIGGQACALAAIIETTELAAQWAVEVYGSKRPYKSTDGDCIAMDLREGDHLKGQSHD